MLLPLSVNFDEQQCQVSTTHTGVGRHTGQTSFAMVS